MKNQITTEEEIEKETSIALNRLAREEMKTRLLADIAVDLQICKLEGLDPREYISELKKEIDLIFEKVKKLKNKKEGDSVEDCIWKYPLAKQNIKKAILKAVEENGGNIEYTIDRIGYHLVTNERAIESLNYINEAVDNIKKLGLSMSTTIKIFEYVVLIIYTSRNIKSTL